MQTIQATDIDVSINKKGNLVLRRNGKVEIVIEHPDQSLFEILNRLLVQERDYDNFCKYWNEKDIHLGSWLTNVLAMDKDRKISWMFDRVIVRFRGV